ncbi:c-Myc-binding protein [Thalictrum thalictroides]|uniref:c-Myc-binding protein n=1 Tax=Thalictrum thalictroides TaxID=46969 RepID=A0A7J6VYK1_THATH|nr:c-Myc-binding protein [Thalictrum thalictroides]
MEKEAKKEAFRKYLESSGVLDALTQVLVALYEQNNKPSSAIEFVQQKLGGPTISEYEKLKAEMSDLNIKYNELLTSHADICKELEGLKASPPIENCEEVVDNDTHKGNSMIALKS